MYKITKFIQLKLQINQKYTINQKTNHNIKKQFITSKANKFENTKAQLRNHPDKNLIVL